MVLLYVIFVMTTGLVNCQSYRNCSAIPTTKSPSIQDILNCGPLLFSWSLGHSFDCAEVVWAKPRFGSKDYFGSAVFTTTLSNQAMVFKAVQTPDQKTYYLTNCTGGCATPTVTQFNTVAFKVVKQETYSCYTICDGDALADFICAANSNRFMNEMQRVVDSMRGVPNGDKIHLSQQNCPTCQECTFLNFEYTLNN